MKKEFYVYGYRRSRESKNGPIGSFYYIGKGKGDRKRTKQHSSPPPTNPEYIVTISKGMSEADAFQLEMLLIALYGRLDNGTGVLRNRTDGGQGPSGIMRTKEHQEKLSAHHRGRKFSESHKARLRASHKGMRGRKHPPETLVKMAAVKRGKVHTAESRLKMSESAKRRGERKNNA